MKVFKTSFWIAIILSFGYMIWQAAAHKGLVCGFLGMESCGFMAWIVQTFILLIILLINGRARNLS